MRGHLTCCVPTICLLEGCCAVDYTSESMRCQSSHRQYVQFWFSLETVAELCKQLTSSTYTLVLSLLLCKLHCQPLGLQQSIRHKLAVNYPTYTVKALFSSLFLHVFSTNRPQALLTQYKLLRHLHAFIPPQVTQQYTCTIRQKSRPR